MLRGGDPVTFVCGERRRRDGDASRLTVSWPGLAAARRDGARRSTSPTARCACACIATRPEAGEFDCQVELGGVVASRQGLNIPGPADELPSVPEEDLEHLRAGHQDRRRPRRAQLRAPAGGHPPRPRAHAHPADREDREAAGGRTRRGHRARRRLHHGRARRPRDRAADPGGADGPEAPPAPQRGARAAVDHRDADARLDGPLGAADARRGRRRRERDPRRHRRRDALAGDGDRRVPGRGRRR